MSIGKKLVSLRTEKGLSQYEVAERLGIQRARYNSWEQDIANPRTNMLHKLADFYNVTPDELLGYSNPDNATIPSWASSKDIRDFKKMLEDDAPVMFDGVPVEGEARQRVMDVLTGLFWEAKEMNKKTYGRKKKNNEPTNDNKV